MVERSVAPRLCIALDSSQPAAALRLAAETEEFADVFKVGLTLFTGGGPEVVAHLAARKPVFLDLKVHDVPAQAAGAAEAAADSGASYLSVHASGGAEMLSAAARAAAGTLKLVAVTVLTSLDAAALAAVAGSASVAEHALRLAELALSAGAEGLVCSPLELEVLRRRFGSSERGGPLLVVPGIRAEAADRHDQKRTSPARKAAALGADIVVVGRPISAASDPADAARRISEELSR